MKKCLGVAHFERQGLMTKLRGEWVLGKGCMISFFFGGGACILFSLPEYRTYKQSHLADFSFQP